MCNLDLLQLLIAKGASVNLADEDGETALLIAARHHFTKGVRILIEQGHADVNHSENINGWTALMIAGKKLVGVILYGCKRSDRIFQFSYGGLHGYRSDFIGS